MSESTLNFLVSLGQIGAPTLAILAAILGALGGWAGKELSSGSNQRLLKLQTQVAAVIGDIWEPLTSKQIDILRTKIEAWHGPAKIFVMYENKFGRDLAESIATAFRAAKWEVVFQNGSGFLDGVKVGRGPEGPNMKKVLAAVLPEQIITVLGEDEQVKDFHVIGVGAKSE